MGKRRGETSKPACDSRVRSRATRQIPEESDEYKKFLEHLRSERVKFPKLTVPLPEDVMAPLRLVHAISALRDGRPIEPSTAQWLANALQKAVNHPAKSAESRGIKRQRGRPVTINDERHLQLALDVYTLRKKLGKLRMPMKDSKDGVDAASMIAKVRHVSVKTVELAWQYWGSFIEMNEAYDVAVSGKLSDVKS